MNSLPKDPHWPFPNPVPTEDELIAADLDYNRWKIDGRRDQHIADLCWAEEQRKGEWQ